MLARPRYGHGDRTEVVGFSVALRPAEEGQPVIWFGGGRLGRELTIPALRALGQLRRSVTPRFGRVAERPTIEPAGERRRY